MGRHMRLALATLAMNFDTPLWIRAALAACGLYALALPFARSSPWADSDS